MDKMEKTDSCIKPPSEQSIGVDIGSISIKAVRLEGGAIRKTVCRPHQGTPREVLSDCLAELGYHEEIPLGLTGSSSGLIGNTLGVQAIDEVKAQVAGVTHFFPLPENIVNLGGSSTTLIRLESSGRLASIVTNSLCAAGTGAFLDHQMGRLGVDLAETAGFASVENPPSIATRCSVFAKTDLIHRQQEGRTIPELWSGLCRGMAETSLNTLLRGRSLSGETVVIGGVAQNREVLRWLSARFGEAVKTFPLAPFAQAIGASLLARNGNGAKKISLPALEISDRKPRLRPPLVLEHSNYPEMEIGRFQTDERGNEIRILNLPPGVDREVYLGIDIGSTSTKLCALADGEVIFDLYRKTQGDPLGATRELFAAVERLQADYRLELTVRGSGTTGSGRKFIGMVIGADRIVNEITAHEQGAKHFFPEVETIFEIGGQDSKYMHLRDGRIHEANMNYVCAAGTGSFVEEVAEKLGFPIGEVGREVTGLCPPYTSERCTVFMEQDAFDLLRQGYSRAEVMAAVIYSIATNYLNRVVGRRPISPGRVFFQGATARNRGLVAAFEKILDREIVVSPHCHIMGAIGAALAAREAVGPGASTRFRGLGVTRRKVQAAYEPCELCANRCRITRISIEGEKEEPSWGYACGREPGEETKKENVYYLPFRERERILARHLSAKPAAHPVATVGIPMALSSQLYLPLFYRLLQELGFRVRFSFRGDENAIERGNEISGGEFCLPAKALYGELAALYENPRLDYIFVPHFIRGEKRKEFSNTHLCPYVQSGPSYLKSFLRIRNLPDDKILAPVLDLAAPDAENVDEIALAFRHFGFTREKIRAAWEKALAAQAAFTREKEEKGREILARLAAEGKPGLVILGRGYNVFDPRVSLQIPLQVSEYGLTVIPYDMVPFEAGNLGPDFQNLFWYNSQNVLAAIRKLKEYPNLFGLYISNFACGPDSFTLSYAEELMGKRPLLILELDEHGSSTGYLTRIESFLDVVQNYRGEEKAAPARLVRENTRDLRKRKIWFPNMHPTGNRLFAAAFRRFGYEAETVPDETKESLELGRKFTRGNECLPLAVTLGNFLKLMEEEKLDPKKQALFFPTSDGPCRYGQYRFFHQLVLSRQGYGDIAIISPTAANGYLGLPGKLRLRLGQALLIGDVIFKLRCRVKPYEVETGATERILEDVLQAGEREFAGGGDYLKVVRYARERFETIPLRDERKPLVGIVGEIFVRCNPFSNDFLAESIERAGGEAWLSPVFEWIFYTSFNHRWKSQRDREPLEVLKSYLKNRWLVRADHAAYHAAGPLLSDRYESPIEDVVQAGMSYFPLQFTTEALITVGRTVLFFARDGARMVVNASPFTCMPGTISTAVFQEVEKLYGAPVLNQFYDGEEGLNLKLHTYLANLPAS